MKILDWMHHKLRNNSIKPFKDLNIGNSCIGLSAQAYVGDQELYPKANVFTSSKTYKPDKDNYSLFEENDSGDSSATICEIFHGFLTIGTLGSEASFNDPGTPTFASTLEYISDGVITESELKLIDFELENFLEENGKEGGTKECSTRNSDASMITLGGKQTERGEDENYWKNLVCPIPEFVYEERAEPKPKKEKIVTTENHAEKCDKNKPKSAMRFVKKFIKKVNPSTKKELSHQPNSISPEKKFPKVLRIFHRKIHPESLPAERESIAPTKSKANESLIEGGYTNRNLTRHLAGDKKGTAGNPGNTDGTSQLQQGSLSCYNFRGKGEHWINIDDDYLVLELDQQKE